MEEGIEDRVAEVNDDDVLVDTSVALLEFPEDDNPIDFEVELASEADEVDVEGIPEILELRALVPALGLEETSEDDEARINSLGKWNADGGPALVPFEPPPALVPAPPPPTRSEPEAEPSDDGYRR